MDYTMKKPRKWARVAPGGLYGWKKTQSDSTRHAMKHNKRQSNKKAYGKRYGLFEEEI